MNKKPEILLLCSSRIAVPVLNKLVAGQHIKEVVVPGMHQEVITTFTHIAQSLHLPLQLLPEKGWKGVLHRLIKERKPDAVWVIGFPWRIPVSELPELPYGYINFHAGLLPQMRGPEPLFECIRRQCTETGLSVHRMDDQLDSGPIVFQEKMPITPETTHGLLSTQMAYKAEQVAGLLLQIMQEGGELPEEVQDVLQADYWPRIRPEELFIRWESMDAAAIKALAKACNPSLKGAQTLINNWMIRIAEVVELELNGDAAGIAPGTILYADAEQGLIVFCKGGRGVRVEVVVTEEGILPGYKLAYFGITPGMKFESPQPAPAAAVPIH